MKRSFILRALTSIILLASFFYFIGFEKILNEISKTILSLFILALAIENLGVFISARRWQIILEEKNVYLKFGEALCLYYMGSFFNSMMPSSFGGDFIKAYKLGKTTNAKYSFSSVMVDRISGLIGVAIIAFISIIFFHSYLPSNVILISLLIIFSFLLLFILLIKTRIPEKIIEILFSRWQKPRNFLNGVMETFKEYKGKKMWTYIILLSLIYHVMLVINNYLLALSLNTNIKFFYFLIFIPVSQILVTLPISIQGFGVREGTYSMLFSSIGVDYSSAFSLGFLNQIVKVITSIIGGIVYVIKK